MAGLQGRRSCSRGPPAFTEKIVVRFVLVVRETEKRPPGAATIEPEASPARPDRSRSTPARGSHLRHDHDETEPFQFAGRPHDEGDCAPGGGRYPSPAAGSGYLPFSLVFPNGAEAVSDVASRRAAPRSRDADSAVHEGPVRGVTTAAPTRDTVGRSRSTARYSFRRRRRRSAAFPSRGDRSPLILHEQSSYAAIVARGARANGDFRSALRPCDSAFRFRRETSTFFSARFLPPCRGGLSRGRASGRRAPPRRGAMRLPARARHATPRFFPSRFNARVGRPRALRRRLFAGLPRRAGCPPSPCAGSPRGVPFFGAGSFTPARRAFDSPIAIACFDDRAPCLPSRM